ncbi:MAG: winged helix-turn-helix domain-containing protein [Candidatus Bathyarchaeota archaeon]|nr:winged helix-turn-helix domain-containing protein [Candidatus Bathyarchaeota archaeon]
MHKILKDETRRKILCIIDEKGGIGYTDLMSALGFLTTGLLNYHLKILGDLVSKNETRQYVLTEKGKLASRLLKEFPQGNALHFGVKPKWWRRFWIEISIALAVISLSLFTVFFLGYVDATGLYRGLVTAVLSVGFAYMMQHLLRDVFSKKRRLFIAKTAYIAGGIALGLWVAYFAVGILLVGISRLSGTRFGYDFFWSIGYQLFALIAAPILSSIAIYRFGKKRRFKTPNYNPDD